MDLISLQDLTDLGIELDRMLFPPAPAGKEKMMTWWEWVVLLALVCFCALQIGGINEPNGNGGDCNGAGGGL